MKMAVLTGDITNFTKLSVLQREDLINRTKEIFNTWVEKPGYAEMFRGDSFQLLSSNLEDALFYILKIRCWFKKQFNNKSKPLLDARVCIGIGEISYINKNVLEADGEAFHLSGRNFDLMTEDDFLTIITPDEKLNQQLKIIGDLLDMIIKDWTVSQAEVLFLVLQHKTQQQIADELKLGQSAINNRIKLSRWKEIEKAMNYIKTIIN